jgi:hypothetical protein
MREQDGRTDPVQQRDQRVAIELLLPGKARKRGKLRGIELIESGIAGLAGARPLRVQMRLRPLMVTLGRDKALIKEANCTESEDFGLSP